jgi:hypothetical protein
MAWERSCATFSSNDAACAPMYGFHPATEELRCARTVPSSFTSAIAP